LLDNVIHAATKAVLSPNQTVPGQTVYDLWDKQIRTMGSGSDFTAFQDAAGIPSLDIGFVSCPDEPVYHYHSNYDSFYWMEKFGDPGFAYHRTMAQVVGLITAQLADLPIISFRAADYAHALGRYVKKVQDKLDEALFPTQPEVETSSLLLADDDAYFELRSSTRNSSIPASSSSSSSSAPSAESFKHSLQRLHKALDKLASRAARLDKRADELGEELKRHIPWWRWPAKLRLGFELRKVNTKYKYLERSFLYDQGLDGRPFFKHVVFAPGLWTGYAGGKFPRLTGIGGWLVLTL
jgi:N-acetylated-alpha-linked acidic dipeptidase